jgi:hypothetical protein
LFIIAHLYSQTLGSFGRLSPCRFVIHEAKLRKARHDRKASIFPNGLRHQNTVLLTVLRYERDTSFHRTRRIVVHKRRPYDGNQAGINGIEAKNRSQDIGSPCPHEASKPNDFPSLYT